MGNNTRVPIIKAPELLDVVINNIQTGLTDNLGWLRSEERRVGKECS